MLWLKKDTGLKEQFILLKGGGRTRRVTIKSLIKDFNLSPSQAKYFYNFLIKYKQIHGNVTPDYYDNLTRTYILIIIGYY